MLSPKENLRIQTITLTLLWGLLTTPPTAWANDLAHAPSAFSCLNDLLVLRSRLAQVYAQHMDAPGSSPSEKKRFERNHQALEGLLFPHPHFPFPVIGRVDFYRKKLLPSYQYFNGQEVAANNKSVHRVKQLGLKAAGLAPPTIPASGKSSIPATPWAQALREMDGETFYRTLFSQAKSDLVLLQQSQAIPATRPTARLSHFSDRYQSLAQDTERRAYFDTCAKIFQADPARSTRSEIFNQGRTAPKKSTPTQDIEDHGHKVLP